MNTKTVLFLLVTLLTINLAKGAPLFISDKTITPAHLKRTALQQKSADLDKFYSSKKLGAFVQNDSTYFRLFAPGADKVSLVLFDSPDSSGGAEHEMIADNDKVWEVRLNGEKYGMYYGFKVYHAGNSLNPVISLDPYAKAVATLNTYGSPRLGIIVNDNNYDWEGDEWIKHDWRDLIIYEMHIKDMTAHPTAGASAPGTYKGLTEKGIPGGIDYIKSLGVNAVELLPAQEFANIEIPFNDSALGRVNTWNPYERNHWGYMTAGFFAPDELYSEDNARLNWDQWSGTSARQVTDFKDMVKAFHKEGIAVIMDVVYNHLSEYEIGNLKQIDKEYYFRLDENGNFLAHSGCGNDLKTERPMVRRMIVESILYWMKEYHVDGFRFDLGRLIDWETVEEIIYEAQKINPDVVIVCEPWGGGYDPMGFSMRGWGSWNDQIRNGIKGENPNNGHGWIFGKWFGNNNPERIKSYVNGTLVKDKHGLFQKKEHSVNYLESHDGYTLGDFIRIGTGAVGREEVVEDKNLNALLTPEMMKLNKLAALFLFTSQGLTMIHSGQEFARSKVIPDTISAADPEKGRLDHNSYNKDNESNYINYEHALLNKELVDYYKGLIALRKEYDAFRRAEYDDVIFFDIKDNPFALGYLLTYGGSEFITLFNAHTEMPEEFILPNGEWDVLVNAQSAGTGSLGKVSSKVTLAPGTGMVLIKK